MPIYYIKTSSIKILNLQQNENTEKLIFLFI